jgi:hypothetical protein
VRLREHELQRSTLVLLALRWQLEEDKNGSIRKAITNASKPETLLAGAKVAKPHSQQEDFRVSLRKSCKAARRSLQS